MCMAVYIKPPKGDIGFHKLWDFVKKRLVFLHFLKGKTSEEIHVGIDEKLFVRDSECLIEGTMKDRTSHFVLRYLCAGNHDMEAFFIQSETELFCYRLEFYDFPDILKILQCAAKQSIQVLTYPFVINSYCEILRALIHVATELDFALKNKVNLKVPFTAALSFVRERLYPLHSGFVEVPLKCVKLLLVSIFEEILCQGFRQIKSSSLSSKEKDPRIQYMHQKVKIWFHSNVILPSSVILNTQIVLENNLNIESKKFPLCMGNLHYQLRNNHRLPHHSRVQYILFLKEIGVPYQEVITLFMKEYSIPASKGITNSCSHSWDKSKNRYIYSIEHLYGKRGSGKNYKSHGCCSLQSLRVSSSSSGGCPFVCFEEDLLHKEIDTCSFKVEDIEDLKLLASQKKYTEACQVHLLKKVIKSQAHTLQHLKEKDFTSSLKTTNDSVDFSSSYLNSNLAGTKHFSDFHLAKDLFIKKISMTSKPSDIFLMLSNTSS